mmetsp:Transcript_2641/g.7014  ORF Transcript_2641/g.7014 Transcript_2641/m.7014 type:complete len:278 (-) Transcript_2641:479-1312(-)
MNQPQQIPRNEIGKSENSHKELHCYKAKQLLENEHGAGAAVGGFGGHFAGTGWVRRCRGEHGRQPALHVRLFAPSRHCRQGDGGVAVDWHGAGRLRSPVQRRDDGVNHLGQRRLPRSVLDGLRLRLLDHWPHFQLELSVDSLQPVDDALEIVLLPGKGRRLGFAAAAAGLHAGCAAARHGAASPTALAPHSGELGPQVRLLPLDLVEISSERRDLAPPLLKLDKHRPQLLVLPLALRLQRDHVLRRRDQLRLKRHDALQSVLRRLLLRAHRVRVLRL